MQVVPNHRQLHIIVAKKPTPDLATRRFRSATYRTSYGLMNQWLGPGPAQRLPGHATEMAEESGLRSVCSIVPIKPLLSYASKRQELSSREKLLYSITGLPNTQDTYTSGNGGGVGTPVSYIPPLHGTSTNGSHLGSRNSRATRIPGTAVSSSHSRRVQDPYWNPGMSPVHQQRPPTGVDDYYDPPNNLLSSEDQAGPTQGQPKLRNGRHGGSWRHVREVMQAKGDRTVFLEGTTRVDDSGRQLQRPLMYDLSVPTSHKPRNSAEAIQRCQPPSLTAYAHCAAGKSTEGINWLVMR